MDTFLKKNKFYLPVAVFLFSAAILSFIQIQVENPMIILERFFKGGGWLEIPLISFYGAYIAYRMQDPCEVAKWRRYSWTVFTVAFFLQLGLGLIGFEKFLMTGKLHLPVPMMIVGGPLYREQISIMTVLFLSTILLSGPAWCSQLCYFGAMDNIAAKGKPNKGKIKNRLAIKSSILFVVIATALCLRWFEVSLLYSTIVAAVFGITGIGVILFFSRRKGKMVHCILYCPIGTIVNYLRFINPFRLRINNSCTLCMRCPDYCKYDALNKDDILLRKPGITCTLCGDCLAACKFNSIQYSFFALPPARARNLYLFITISLHAVFLALARI